ncbi:ankyrin repeat-containing domain protein [Aspergillus pseudoustus]|uniref:Ankyrin repeat-containing domain protein n=1 Tax=Aspergillus pseudoustus TaxID=1810923 RepID=A0ABR4J4B7_9EURO
MAFPEYALRYWTLHCARIGENGRRRDEVKDLLSELLQVAPIGTGLLTLMRCWSGWFENAFYHRHIDDSVGTTPSPFFLACVWNFVEIINVAVEQTPEIVHALGKNGRPGLHIAAYYSNDQIVRRLLGAGADVNGVDPSSHQTPLFVAADGGHISTIRELLTRENIDVNAMNRNMQTALFGPQAAGTLRQFAHFSNTGELTSMSINKA